MKEVYRSRFEAYPFLCDNADDLRCDFEILTDEIASMTGVLRAFVKNGQLRDELLYVCNLVYHINPSLRTKVTATVAELERLDGFAMRLKDEAGSRCRKFVLTQGSQAGAMAHVLRVKCKALVRLLYRHSFQGHEVDNILLDFANLLSGYFFYLALRLNELDGVDEIEYTSLNY